MNMKIARILLMIISTASAYANGGLSDMQAVCRVTLKDGQIVEGVVLVATGGYFRFYDTNGFYLYEEREEDAIIRQRRRRKAEEVNITQPPTRVSIEEAVLFQWDFKAIEPYKGRVYTATGGHGWGDRFKNPKVYFMHDVSSRERGVNHPEAKHQLVDGKDTAAPLLLRRTIVHRMDYELLEYVPIFPKVPDELYVGRKPLSVQPLRVNLTEVERFELVREPSQDWIDEISRVEKAWLDAHPDPTGETGPPVWFHNIVKIKEFKDLFKPWEL